MEKEQKKYIANICENLYQYCVEQIPQVENEKIIWILNGSTLCNILYNVEMIDGKFITPEFNEACLNFIRQPKGDIDITYKADRKYKFDMDAQPIKNFQEISEEVRTYNFVDSNSILNDDDIKQLCQMRTKNGFTFFAKKPQFIFIYKLTELLAVFNNEILTGNIEKINDKKKNIIRDIKSLYSIAVSYSGEKMTLDTIDMLPHISETLHKLYETNEEEYKKLVSTVLNIIKYERDFNGKQ